MLGYIYEYFKSSPKLMNKALVMMYLIVKK